MGLDVNRFASIARVRKYDSKTLRIVTVARLNQTKGHLYALAAMAKARDAGVASTTQLQGRVRFGIPLPLVSKISASRTV